MSVHQARELAQTLCDTTELVLLPIIPAWTQRYSRKRAAKYPRPAIRVGGGRATHHRFDLHSGEHSITFGAKMVADKLDPRACASWLSTREILARGYFDGRVSAANLLAHTGCHEFAHLVQTVSGGRTRGSVHNSAFYRILDDLHRDGIADGFRQSLLELARNRGQMIPDASVQIADPREALASFKPGDVVCFGRNNELQGKVTRVNRKTCSVQGTGPCEGRRYRVSPQALTPLS
ncbi:hypothetical protein [Hydrocarboniclastica marina]|nr:hypothetical protein [Hydrocarboniclastica marina]